MATRVREHLEQVMDADPELRAEYDRLAPRMEAVRALLDARSAANVSQAELGRRMGASQGAVSRLESAEHDPRLGTLAKAADALGYRLEVRFKRRKAKPAA